MINVDDPAGPRWSRGSTCRVSRSGWRRAPMCGHGGSSRRWTASGWRCETPRGALEISSSLVGEHNVMNLLGATAVGLALDMDAARGRRGARVRELGARALRAGRGRGSRSSWWWTTRIPRMRSSASSRPRDSSCRPGPARRGLRLRGRSRSRQAARDGRNRRAARRSHLGHLGQSAQRAARGHHRRDRRRVPPDSDVRHAAVPDRRTAIRAALASAGPVTWW